MVSKGNKELEMGAIHVLDIPIHGDVRLPSVAELAGNETPHQEHRELAETHRTLAQEAIEERGEHGVAKEHLAHAQRHDAFANMAPTRLGESFASTMANRMTAGKSED